MQEMAVLEGLDLKNFRLKKQGQILGKSNSVRDSAGDFEITEFDIAGFNCSWICKYHIVTEFQG